MSSVSFARSTTVTCLFAVFVAGCGPGGGGSSGTPAPAGGNKVSGSVKLGDQKVMYGVVAFHIGDRVVKAPIAPDGTYSIHNPPPGEAKVVVQADAQPPRMAAAAGKPTEPPPKFVAVSVPAKYADKEKTDLTYTVGSGPQTYDIKMKAE